MFKKNVKNGEDGMTHRSDNGHLSVSREGVGRIVHHTGVVVRFSEAGDVSVVILVEVVLSSWNVNVLRFRDY